MYFPFFILRHSGRNPLPSRRRFTQRLLKETLTKGALEKRLRLSGEPFSELP